MNLKIKQEHYYKMKILMFNILHQRFDLINNKLLIITSMEFQSLIHFQKYIKMPLDL